MNKMTFKELKKIDAKCAEALINELAEADRSDRSGALAWIRRVGITREGDDKFLFNDFESGQAWRWDGQLNRWVYLNTM